MVAGVLIVIGAAIVLVYMLGWSHEELDKGRRGGGGYQVIVLLGGAVLVGLLLIGNAIRGLQN